MAEERKIDDARGGEGWTDRPTACPAAGRGRVDGPPVRQPARGGVGGGAKGAGQIRTAE
jgi:hypothetical protein